MKTIAILKKNQIHEARFMHLDKFYIGRGTGSYLGNEWSHLPKSLSKYKVATVEEAVRCHRNFFIGMVNDYKNPAYRSALIQLRSMYDARKNGSEIALVCHCMTRIGDISFGGPCHALIISEFLEILGEHYETKGMAYCAAELKRRYNGTAAPSTKDAGVNEFVQNFRTGQI